MISIWERRLLIILILIRLRKKLIYYIYTLSLGKNLIEVAHPINLNNKAFTSDPCSDKALKIKELLNSRTKNYNNKCPTLKNHRFHCIQKQ